MQTTAQGPFGLPTSKSYPSEHDKTTLSYLQYYQHRAFGVAVLLHTCELVNPWYLIGASFCALVANLRFQTIYEDAPRKRDWFRVHFNLISFLTLISAFVLFFEQIKGWAPWWLLRIILGEVFGIGFNLFLAVFLRHSPNGWRIELEQTRISFHDWVNQWRSLDPGASNKMDYALLSIRLVLIFLFDYLFLTIAWILMLLAQLIAIVPSNLFEDFGHLLRFALTGSLRKPESDHYQYNPILSPDEYRLIEMERWRPFRPLKLRLVHCNLTKPMAYEAISYCWGNPTKARKIRISDKMMLVPQSTYEVLHGRSSFWRSRKIWLDSICINQSDNHEKSYQVRMMKRIYENADRVVIWLGGSSLVTFIGVALIQEVIDYMKTKSFSGEQVHSRYFLERLGFRWRCLDLILNQPWFFRLWIIQEASVAKVVHVVSGCFYIDFDLFQEISRLAYDPTLTLLITLTSKGRASRQASGNVATIFDIRDQLADDAKALADAEDDLSHISELAETDPRRLLNLLLECDNFQATDKRDYVFALFGLAIDVSSANQDLGPDYTRDTYDVYKKLALFFLKGDDPFARLCTTGIGYQRSIENLPSWVPDLSQPRQCWELDKPHFTHGRYKACGDTSAEISFLNVMSMSACRVTGVQITRIKVIAREMTRHNDENKHLFGDGYFSDAKQFLDGCNWLHENYVLAKNYAKPIDISDFFSVSEFSQLSESQVETLAIGEPFWRTLIGNRSTESYPAKAESSIKFAEWINLRSWFGEYNGLPKDKDMSSVERQLLLDRDLQMPPHEDFRRRILNLADYHHSVQMTAGGRRFAVMEDGSMGMVPSGAQIGDEVYVFCGARVPVLLRRWQQGVLKHSRKELAGSGNEDLSKNSKGNPEQKRLWQLVGDCFVYGIMDGEVFASNDFKLEQIILI